MGSVEGMSDLTVKTRDEDVISILKKNGYMLYKFEKTPERCMTAVRQTGGALKHIPKAIQTLELCLEAVKQNGRAIRYVSKKILNEEICITAVENKGDALGYIPDEFLTSKLYNKAVKKDGLALRFVDEEKRTERLCKNAVLENGKALKYVPKKFISKELCEKAVLNNGISLEFVPGKWKSKKLCLSAINNNGMALEFVPGRFKNNEMCKIALDNNWRAFLYVSEDMYSISICCSFFKSIIESGEMEHIDSFDVEEIVENLPEEVNEDPEVIKLERQLGARKFVKKAYDKGLDKFIIQEYISYKEDDETKEFDDFRDFYNYLDGDLKGADLYHFKFEDIDLSNFNVDGALISGEVLSLNNLYDDTFYNNNIKKYINDADLTFLGENNIVERSVPFHEDYFECTLDNACRKIYYISDIHINHKLMKEFPKYATRQEVIHFIRKFIKNMVMTVKGETYYNYLMIAGDLSFSYEISSIFYSELVKLWNPAHIITVLGNHELWDFNRSGQMTKDKVNLDDIISKYKELFNSLGINFLHNSLLILEEGRISIISQQKLKEMTKETLRRACLKSSLIVLGGLGFSGYNPNFNAENGIYRNTIRSLEEDVKETKRFEKIYKIVNDAIGDKKVIVLTHTPKENWSHEAYNSKWIYVNGHTHKNSYHCDENYTVYSDNQVGYYLQSAGLKYFNLSKKYDVFKYYPDGIYTITSEEYLDFYRGRNLNISFNRVDGSIYMLKNSGFYCFIFKRDKTEKIYLLNGGSIKTLDKDINYYFENMVSYSKVIKEMFKEYHKALKSISQSIKEIGGSGTIHGAIVDIDYFNHVYLNPEDGKITPYFALSITEKYVYKNIEGLLKENAKELYLNYKKLIKSNEGNNLQLIKCVNKGIVELPQFVSETFMYKDSRTLKIIQYLIDDNVIRIWEDKVVKEAAFL